MTDHDPPVWVRDGDGNVVPFETDRICQSLFAATEELGRPDAFLARELTDGVVHFLAEEFHGSPPGVAELTELVAKVVRELGQPALAQRFEESSHRPPPAAALAALSGAPASATPTAFALSDVFPRNLVAAERDGLLTIWGQDHPLEFTGSVLGAGQGPVELLVAAREHTSGFVAIDAPEYALAAAGSEPGESASRYVGELRAGLEKQALAAVVNLNLATPPSWDRDLGAGPLFADVRLPADPERVAEHADALLRAVAAVVSAPTARPHVEIAWHLSAADFAGENSRRLLRVADFAANGFPVEFCFDRPRRAVSLGPGLGRGAPAVLMAVGVHLPALADLTPAVTADRFLEKLGTLARLARSAGHAKQDFLRRQACPAVTRGFLLDRARLVVTPVGLEAVVRRVTGQRICEVGRGADFAREILASLKAALAHEKPRTMDAGLDAAPPLTPYCPLGGPKSNKIEGVAGLTTWDSEATAQQQLRTCGKLHGVADGGTAAVLTTEADGESLASLLQFAWTQTEVARLRFTRPA